MALTTRCPQCGTTFKVVPDQLRVRNGLVRCGSCSTVFDGRACLLPEAGAPVMPAPQNAVAPSTVSAPVLAQPAAPAPAAAPIAQPIPLPPAAPAFQPPSPPAAPVIQPPPAVFRAPEQRGAVAPPAVAPWDDGPDEPALRRPTAAPAVPPAVLRGRDDIRRRAEPGTGHAEDDGDDIGDDADESPDPLSWAAPAAPSRPVYRDEPIVASRGREPAIDWDAPRRERDDAPAEPVFSADDTRRDDDYDRDDRDDRDERLDHDDRHHDDREDHDHDGDSRDPILGEARTRYSSATDVGRAPPEFLDQDRQERRGLLRKLWGYACLIGLIALGLQLLYAYRTDIANSVPVLRPVLETVCQPIGCTVGYARRLERIAISSSSLQPPPGAAAIDDGRSRLVLNLVLRNRYDKPQHWPALVLDLTDLSDTVVVRRVLMPENYLTPEQLRGPFAPAGELKISVPIEVTGVQVNGYQLDKFFP